MNVGWEVEVTDEPDRVDGVVVRGGYVRRFQFGGELEALKCLNGAKDAGFEATIRRVGRRDKEGANA